MEHCITAMFMLNSPCPLVVKKKHQVKFLIHLLLPLLPQTEDIFGWDGDRHPIVQQALLRHLRVNDLKQTQPNREFKLHPELNAHIK